MCSDVLNRRAQSVAITQSRTKSKHMCVRVRGCVRACLQCSAAVRYRALFARGAITRRRTRVSVKLSAIPTTPDETAIKTLQPALPFTTRLRHHPRGVCTCNFGARKIKCSSAEFRFFSAESNDIDDATLLQTSHGRCIPAVQLRVAS
jgi:hypothetical protein